MAFCTNCGSDVGDAKFCTECGAPTGQIDSFVSAMPEQPYHTDRTFEATNAQAGYQSAGYEAPTTAFSSPDASYPTMSSNATIAPVAPSDPAYNAQVNQVPQYGDFQYSQNTPVQQATQFTRSAEPKKKSKIGLIIAIIAAVLVIGALVATVFIFDPFNWISGGNTETPGVATGTDPGNGGTDAVENEGLLALKDAEVGDVVYFGEITYTTHRVVDGKGGVEEKRTTDIGWRVLAIEDGKALLISDTHVGAEQFNNKDAAISWEDSSLHSWLNGDFYDALPTEVKNSIVETEIVTSGSANTNDKVFLLSAEEAEKYFKDNNSRTVKNSKAYWWLRSLGNDADLAAYVNGEGEIHKEGLPVVRDNIWVRPVFYVTIPS